VLLLIVGTVSAPWLVAIWWAWRHRPRDGAVPLSLGEQVRRRLWPQ